MKRKWLIYYVGILTVFYSFSLAQDDNTRGENNLSPEQLIDSWEKASRGERRAIENSLYENISDSLPILRQKVLVGSHSQKMFACSMIAQMRDLNSAEVLVKALDDLDIKVKTR